jgi:hypothetical protein
MLAYFVTLLPCNTVIVKGFLYVVISLLVVYLICKVGVVGARDEHDGAQQNERPEPGINIYTLEIKRHL